MGITAKEKFEKNVAAGTASLLKRVEIFLEDEEWERADEYCEKVLDIDPENAEAYLGKLLAELHVSKKEDLVNLNEHFQYKNNYKKVRRFGDAKLCEELQKYNMIIRERNVQEYEEKHYLDACNAMRVAQTEKEFKKIADDFEDIIDYLDSNDKKEECLELAETARKEAIYDDACSFKNQQTIKGYEAAILSFEQIFGFKDAEEQVTICRREAEELKIAEEKARIEAERKAETERIATKAKNKKVKIIEALIAIILVSVFSVFGIKSVNENKNRIEAISESLIGKTFVFYEHKTQRVEDAIKEPGYKKDERFCTMTYVRKLTFVSEDKVEYTDKYDWVYSDYAKSIRPSLEDTHHSEKTTFSYTVAATNITIDDENWKIEYDKDTMTVISITDDSGYHRGDVYKIQK